MVAPGNVADLAFALQSAKGTGASASQYRTALTGGGAGPVKDINDIEETTGSRLRSSAYVSQVRAEGSPQMVVRPNLIGLLLYGGLGAKAVTGAADPFTHTFTLADTQPWLTVWRMLANGLFEKFTDCKVSSLEFASDAGGLLQVTAGIVGAKPSYLEAHEDTVGMEVTNAFVHADGQGAFQIENAAVSSIDEVRANINGGVTGQQGDAVTLDDIKEGLFDITISTRQTISDFGLWNRLHYGSASPADGAEPTRDVLELGGSPAGIDFKYTRPGTPERSLQFTATRLQVTNISGIEPNTGGEPIRMSVDYKVYQPASGSGLTAVLKNGVTAYAAA